MAILKEPYEISLWDDVLGANGEFTEKRLCVIGTDKMQSQNRALEPTLTTNVNGQKKFSFQMYKRYTDVVTGEEVENLFYGYLINERKVKLKYRNKWYDFIIKNVSETSTNYLYKYDLEDALVQELSKNGFNVTLDPEMMNNSGTAKELAEYVLQDTDWKVESDVFVQTVEESLVYVTTNKTISGVKWIKDPQGTDEGIDDNTPVEIGANQKLLAFYSSCTDKPHRFQFIKLGNGVDADYAKDSVQRDANRVITEKDCQYYVDIKRPNTPLRNLLNNYDDYKYTNQYELGRYSFGVTPKTQTALTITIEGEIIDKEVEITTLNELNGKYAITHLNPFCYFYDESKEEGKKWINIESDPPITWNSFSDFQKKGRQTVSATFKYKGNTSPDHVIVYAALSKWDNDTKKWVGVTDPNTQSHSTIRDAILKANGGAKLYRIKIEYGTEFTGWAANDSKLPGGVPSEVGQAGYRDKTNGFYLPDGFEVSSYYELGDGTNKAENAVTVSTWYRGARYGFAQKQTYSPTLDRYVEHYTDGSGKLIYGYTQAKFESPVFNQNLASNYAMQGTGGWKEVNNTEEETVFENKFGKLVQKSGSNTKYTYTDSIDTLNAGNITDTTFNGYKNYLYVVPANTGSYGDYFILNNGPYDNRTLLSPFAVGDEFLLRVEVYNYALDTSDNKWYYNDQTNNSVVVGSYVPPYQLREVVQTSTGYRFARPDEQQFSFERTSGREVNGKKYLLYKLKSLDTTQNLKKKHQLRIAIEIISGWGNGYLIGNIEFYKVHRDEQGNIIPPVLDNDNNVTVESGNLEKRHYYFLPSEIQDANKNPIILSEDESINYLTNTSIRDYTTYKPIYNNGAEKVRQVSVKESNYFNILQTIAEKFECWVTLEVERDAKGGIDSKKVCLRRYAGGDNYAAFRYGVNLKDITRVINSQQIVSKLIVKPNVNEYAEGGVCTIATAGANPTGETAIYDFGYYHNKGLLDATNYLKTVWAPWSGDMDYVVFRNCTNGFEGEDFREGGTSRSFGPTWPYNTYVNGDGNWTIRNTGNATHFCTDNDGDYSTGILVKPTGALNDLTSYFPKLKAINNKLLKLNEFRNQKQMEYNEAKAKFDVADAKLSAAIESKLELEEKFEGAYGLGIGDLGDRISKIELQELSSKEEASDDKKYNTNGEDYSVSYTEEPWIKGVRAYIMTKQYDWGSKMTSPYTFPSTTYEAFIGIEVHGNAEKWGEVAERTVNVTIMPKLTYNEKVKKVSKTVKVTVKSQKGSFWKPDSETLVGFWGKTSPDDNKITHSLEDDKNVQKLQKEYTKSLGQIGAAEEEKISAESLINELQPLLTNYDARIQGLIDLKTALNKAFFQQYSRFIQEGTWINEEYIDANKYYADALSTMYNSCYPQVAYTFNVLPISQLPGYEDFNFELGEKTYAEDPEFFGEDENGYPYREEVIIAEKVENLDDPSKHSVKVQNFKNQFQDLFQRITATVQQAQYSTGAYERAATLAEADSKLSKEFLTGTLQEMANGALAIGNNPDIEVGAKHITARNAANSSTLKLVGGAILFGKGDAGEEEWKTGLTADGIAADLITAGTIDTARINIMKGTDAAFVLNEDGLTGYDYVDNSSIVDSFVRFDKHGIYGINGSGGDFLTDFGRVTSKSKKLEKIDEYATFALTWDGLKVTGNTGVVAKIGKTGDNIINITKGAEIIFQVDNDGDAVFGGTVRAKKLEITPDATVTGLNYNDLDDLPVIPSIDGFLTSDDLKDYIKNDDLQTELNNLKVAYRGDVTSSSTKDTATGIITTTHRYTGADGKQYTTITKTAEGEDYLIVGHSKGTQNDTHTNKYFMVSKEGLLTADNAIIHGTIYATDGEFNGQITANSGYISDSVAFGPSKNFYIGAQSKVDGSTYNFSIGTKSNQFFNYSDSSILLRSANRFEFRSTNGKNYLIVDQDRCSLGMYNSIQKATYNITFEPLSVSEATSNNTILSIGDETRPVALQIYGDIFTAEGKNSSGWFRAASRHEENRVVYYLVLNGFIYGAYKIDKITDSLVKKSNTILLTGKTAFSKPGDSYTATADDNWG